ncbi:hypothetical protein ALC62_10157 [Cyphomyrmex costatus]|uniref:Uncharacterized protein n=1 Tax=Cyphomyrmex costatus TaxID=456900 RepID=A0A195CGH6_9HYME|nr:hypothetical protein ALC62_10157 [Cyphomyrmex costatus]
MARIGDDLGYLRAIVARLGDLSKFPWTPPMIVAQAICAQHRVLYFVHGKSLEYNYAMQARMFVRGSELACIVNHEIRLRPLIDSTHVFGYPLSASTIGSGEMTVIRHVWRVANTVFNHRRRERHRNAERLRFIIFVYSSWAYYRDGDARYNDERRRPSWDRSVLELHDRFDDVFSLESFARCHRENRRLVCSPAIVYSRSDLPPWMELR